MINVDIRDRGRQQYAGTAIQPTGNRLVHGESMNDTGRETCLLLLTTLSILNRSGANGETIRALFGLSKCMTAGSFGMFLSNTLLSNSSAGRINPAFAHKEIASELKARSNSQATHGTSYRAELELLERRALPAAKTPVMIAMIPEQLLREGFTNRAEQLSHFINSQTGRPQVVAREWKRI